MQNCKTCKQAKSLDQFYKSHKTRCRDCFVQRQKEYYRANSAVRQAYQTEYFKDNRKEYAQRAELRRVRVRQAVPLWYDEFDVFVYLEAKDLICLRRQVGLEYHLDHIIPLRGRTVCGLHYHKNWQLLPACENRRKSNSFFQE